MSVTNFQIIGGYHYVDGGSSPAPGGVQPGTCPICERPMVRTSALTIVVDDKTMDAHANCAEPQRN